MTADSTPKSENSRPSQPECPAGRADCNIIEEITELRQSLTELSNLVGTDPLTSLANYRQFIQALEQEIERTGRTGQPTTLIMLDIDFFKQVNDRWGHEVGNQALILIAKLLQQTVRKLDIPCRYGGEEFAVILPNTELRASIPVAERLRQVIEETPLSIGEEQLSLTVSLGIDTLESSEATDPEELIRRADHYLYQAKQNGRNQIQHPELPTVAVVSRAEKDSLANLFGRKAEAKKEKSKGEQP